MAHRLKRVLSLIVCICMCVGLLPGVPAGATYGTLNDEHTAIAAGEASNTTADTIWGPIPDNWHGHVIDYGYDATTQIVTLQVGSYQNPFANAWASGIQYNTNVVQLLDIDKAAAEEWHDPADIIDVQKIPEEILTQAGKAAYDKLKNFALNKGMGPLAGLTETSTKDLTTGTVVVTLTTKTNLATGSTKDYYNSDSSSNLDMGAALIPLYNLYFKVTDTNNLSYNTFQPVESTSIPKKVNGAKTVNAEGTNVSEGFYKTGDWPAEPDTFTDVTVTVKADTTPLAGATVNVTGTSQRGNAVDVTSGKTDESGQVIVNLPYSDSTGYTLKVNPVTVGSDLYAMKAEQGKNFSVAGDSTTVEFIDMQKVEVSYEIPVKVFDAAGKAVDISKDAAITLGGTGAASYGADGTATIKLTSTGNKELQVSVPGYQKVTAGTANIAVGVSGDQLTLHTGAMNNPAAAISIAADGGASYIKLVLQKTVTNVSFPLPVPEVSAGVPITEAQAQGLTVTLTPTAGSTADTELGGALELSVGKGIAITKDENGNVTGITVTAPLPDGAYAMQVAGAGFEAADNSVNVITVNGKTLVNIGGKATTDESGNITAIEGGATGTATTTPDDTGNGSIDLSGSVTEGGTIDVGTGEVAGGTDKGSLNDTTIADGLKPTVVTDPIYRVVVKEAVGSSSSTPVYQAEVYLKNAVSGSGTFGLYFDPTLFDVKGSFDENVTFSSKVKASDAPEKTLNAARGYVTFGWEVAKDSDKIDASTSEQLLATIKLPVTTQSTIVQNLGEYFDKYAVYTMDYAQTADGMALLGKGNDAVVDALLSPIWRRTGRAASSADAVKLDDSKATRGGFYQIMVGRSGADEADVTSDIRMEFVLPAVATKLRADFHVSDALGSDISGATVRIFDKTEGLAVATATPIKELTTDEYGRAYARIDAGTYYYTVEHASFWTYPDGTVNTDKDNKAYDTFTIGENVLTTSGKNAADDTNTAVVGQYISPVMGAKSYHKTALSVVDDTPAAVDPQTATLSGMAQAYNDVDYYFTIAPKAGYEWNTQAPYDTMDKVAAALSVTLYDADKAATAEDGMYRTKKQAGTVTVTWDAESSRFKIAGSSIKGNAVGEVAERTEDWFDKLRAGDVVIAAKADMFKTAELTLDVQAGTGGKVAAKEPNPARDQGSSTYQKDGTAAANLPITGADAITETLKDGRTDSAVYTFSAEEGKKLDKVIVNGVEITLTEAQKLAYFSYQFHNVSGDESIIVTFADTETGTPVSDPVVTLTLGANGKAESSYTDTKDSPVTNEALTGPANKAYVAKAGETFTVVLTPDKTAPGYQFDTVLVDGAKQTLTANADTGFYTDAHTITFDTDAMAAGQNHTVVVTFKQAKKDAPSTQAIVTSKIEEGFGLISPVGVSIHGVGDTPTFAVVPDDNWTMQNKADSQSVVVNGADKSTAVKTEADGTFTYTTDPLPGGNTDLAAKLVEKTHRVIGNIKTVATSSSGRTIKPAKLTFVRAAQPGGTDEKKLVLSSGVAATNAGLLAFDVQLPAGEWTLTVEKAGYLRYTVSGFKVSEQAVNTIYFGDGSNGTGEAKAESDIKTIELIPGDASGDGTAISSDDLGTVVSGWIANAKQVNKDKADIDESASVTVDDMTNVTGHFYNLRVSKTYDEFCTPTPAA